MLIKTHADAGKVTFFLPEKFNFTLKKEFQKNYKQHPKDSSFIVDFSDVKMIDSTAMAVLLLFREYAGEEKSKISIIKCSPMIRKQFEVAFFLDFFHFD